MKENEHEGVAKDSIGQAGSTGTSGCGSCLHGHSTWGIDCSVHLRLVWEKEVVTLVTLKQYDRAQQPAEEETEPGKGGRVSRGEPCWGVVSQQPQVTCWPSKAPVPGKRQCPHCRLEDFLAPGRCPYLLVSPKHGAGGYKS